MKKSYLSRNFWLGPDQRRGVEHVEIVEPLVSIMATMEINFIAIYSSGVVVSAGWDGPERLRITPT